MRRALLFLLGALLVAATGCGQSFCIAEGTLPERPGDYQVVGPATGTSYAGYLYILDLFPVHFGPTDPAGAARDDALAQNQPANALVGAALDSRVMLIPIPFLHIVLNVTSIEGTGVKATVAAPEKPQPKPEAKAPEKKPSASAPANANKYCATCGHALENGVCPDCSKKKR